MKTLEAWFGEYSASHRHPINQKIHFICVPLIYFSVLGLLWVIPPMHLGDQTIPWILPIILLVSVYYLLLDLKLGLMMMALTIASAWILRAMEAAGLPILWINAGIFIVAWIGQAYGHKLEGKKPSFFKDLAFLLIGPLWILRKALGRRASGDRP
jgi:uncharacterized membrane protein YGL010W